jgi:hypothetical protein
MDALPSLAWINYKRKENEFLNRSKIASALNTDNIAQEENAILKNFTPKLRHVVSRDSGRVSEFNQQCYIVAYNTLLKNKDGFSKRCLAIYTQENGKYKLVSNLSGHMRISMILTMIF